MSKCSNCMHAGYPMAAPLSIANPGLLKAALEEPDPGKKLALIEEITEKYESGPPKAMYPCAKLEEKYQCRDECDMHKPIVEKAWDPFAVFEIVSGVVRCTDPCYGIDTWCAGDVEVIPGKYNAAVWRDTIDDWGRRVHALMVWHVDKDRPMDGAPWEKTDIDGGVDSGQFGFFDKAKFQGRDADEDVYSQICDQTLTAACVGKLEWGAVSSTGFGDGSYPVYALRDADGKAYALKAVYIGDDEEDEEGEDDYDDPALD